MPWTVPVSNKFLTRKFQEITEITNLTKPLMILDESKTVKDLNGGLLRSFNSQKAKKSCDPQFSKQIMEQLKKKTTLTTTTIMTTTKQKQD